MDNINKNNLKNGFTLIELLVAIGIVGILIGIGVPMYQNYSCSAKVEVAHQNLKQIYDYAVLSALKCEYGMPSFVRNRYHWRAIGKTQILTDGSSSTSPGCPMKNPVHLEMYLKNYMMNKLDNPWKNRVQNKGLPTEFYMISNYIAKTPDAWGDIDIDASEPGSRWSLKFTLVPGSCQGNVSDPYVYKTLEL